MLEFLLNKVTGLHDWDFNQKILQQRCFPVKFAKFLRKPILKNICERLLMFCLVLLFRVNCQSTWNNKNASVVF